MDAPPAWLPELHDLLELLYEDRFSELNAQRLNELLASGKEQRDYYITYMDVHSYLAWNGVQQTVEVGREQLARPRPTRSDGQHTDCSRAILDVQPALPPATTHGQLSAAPAFLSTTLHATLGYFSEGMPLAYLIATVITGLGLLAGSLIHVSQPEQLVPSVVAEAKAEYVGRITGMVDCRWAGIDSRGLLGRKYELASGLMEITYDTGAKVILQGPVTYEVESNGGYLAVGKLTGKLDKRNDECRMANGECGLSV